MVKSLVNSVAHKYAASTNSKAGNEDGALESRFGMKHYMKFHGTGSAVRWFLFLFSAIDIALGASFLIVAAIFV